ncbi:hypothetical protein SARC_07032 [Sphaeroforma arctica JP610]|uniref:Uncharacterized protein n=1 Tax=Sphaeroforma arctica JP610 TaxID=667725 RepID=A0A0L0FVG1_9EUKA|nr:hypothetical protein SARC_07032 [Sphaeroforma arctica JP610]KNC80609.1 hypothetical protein SARC_07032 [Sphaeroforma arctica JP610]|eukprot:XP_014154511.1 hypothetical protein SARC_07032 [Sphaeroforma arctica JP610]
MPKIMRTQSARLPHRLPSRSLSVPTTRRNLDVYSIYSTSRKTVILICVFLSVVAVYSTYRYIQNNIAEGNRSLKYKRVPVGLASSIHCTLVDEPDKWTSRTCVFTNALIHEGQIIVFAPEGTTADLMVQEFKRPTSGVGRTDSLPPTAKATPLHRFLRKQGKKNRFVVNVNAGYPPDEGTSNLKIHVKRYGDDLPEYPNFPPVDSTAVMFNPNWPENVGHYLFDDIFASFDAVASVGLSPYSIHLVKLASCQDMYLGFFKEMWKGKSQYKRCHKFYSNWTNTLVGTDVIISSTLAPQTPADMDSDPNADMPEAFTKPVNGAKALFFKKVVVGISRTNVRLLGNRNESWMIFRHNVLLRLGLLRYDKWNLNPEEKREVLSDMVAKGEVKLKKGDGSDRRTLMVVLEKVEGKHARQILNYQKCVDAIAGMDEIGTLVTMAPAGQSLRTQVLLYVLADTVFSAPGGITMFSGFLRRNALALYPDHYDPLIGSYHLEPVWDEMSHFVYQDIPIEWKDLRYHDITMFQKLSMSQTEVVRDWTNLVLDLDVLESKLLEGLAQARIRRQGFKKK